MYLCVDIGGTKTLLALLDPKRPVPDNLLHSIQFPTPKNQADFYEQLLCQIRINFCVSDLELISVAVPGPVKNGKILYLGNLPWHDFNLAQKLSKDLNKPVYLENDANLAALAEAQNKSGKTIYLTFSTGIGGGIIKNNRLTKDSADFEPGHLTYTYTSQTTPTPETAEWEDLASASAIRRLYNDRLVQDITDKTALNDISARIALGLAPIIKQYRPSQIIFGGPLGLILDSYRLSLRRHLHSSLPSSQKLPRLSIAKFGSFSVIYGCYYYAKSQQK